MDRIEALERKIMRLEGVLKGQTSVPLRDGFIARYVAASQNWEVFRDKHVGTFRNLSEAADFIKESRDA